jgi:uncharacterized protein (TIGR04222 family)
VNPLDLPGPAFLAFYVVALVVAHFAGKGLVRLCRSDRAEDAPLPAALAPSEAAYLAGGTERAIDMALVRLLRHQLIGVKAGGGGFEVRQPLPTPANELQQEVYREIGRGNGDVAQLRRLRGTALARTRVRLANEGLLLQGASAEAMCVRIAKGVPFAAVIALGGMKIMVGIARHRPVAFLVVLVLVSLGILALKLFSLPLRAARGERALQNLHRRNAALQIAARRRGAELDDGSLMLAVALFGTQVLANGEFAWMQEGFVTRQSTSSDSSGGSCSGCGGGGCGGCGG